MKFCLELGLEKPVKTVLFPEPITVFLGSTSTTRVTSRNPTMNQQLSSIPIKRFYKAY